MHPASGSLAALAACSRAPDCRRRKAGNGATPRAHGAMLLSRLLFSEIEVAAGSREASGSRQRRSRRGRVHLLCPAATASIPISCLAGVAFAFLAYRLVTESMRSRAFASTLAQAQRPSLLGAPTSYANLTMGFSVAASAAPVAALPDGVGVGVGYASGHATGVGDASGASTGGAEGMGTNGTGVGLNAADAADGNGTSFAWNAALATGGNETLPLVGIPVANATLNATTPATNVTVGNSTENLGDIDTTGTTRAGLPIGNANHSSVEVRKGNDVLRIPQGARLTGTTPAFRGVRLGNSSMLRGQNITRVSYALFKIIKLFGFNSMIDSPAGDHTEWMSRTMQRVEFDRPSFRYWGIDANRTSLERAREAIGGAARADFRHTDISGTPPTGVNVIFHWTELDGTDTDPRSEGYPAHIAGVLAGAKRSNATYIIFGQYPRQRGFVPAYRHGRWLFLGDGASVQPFLYNDYVRGVVPVMGGKNPFLLYMTFYSVRAVRL